MRNLTKRFACAAVVAVTIAIQPAYSDEDMSKETAGGNMLYDLVLARPIGLVSIVVGSVGFVLALPFTIVSGSVDKAAEEMVYKPTRYTFKRPLGEIQKAE